MKRAIKALAALMCGFWFALAATEGTYAVEPGEMLSDPALETRAREIGKELRCLVCQNQSIDDSDADLAHDLRVLVRQRILAGDTNEEVKQYIVARYGNYVLLRPPFMAETWFLWFAPALLSVVALVFAANFYRHRAAANGNLLTDEERARVNELIQEGGGKET